MKETKRYLGDGVYVDFDGYQIVLTTENGIETTNKIYLETPVYNALTSYVAELQRSKNEQEASSRSN